jgi:hypothetical protein
LAIEKGVKLAEKLSQLWVSADFGSKQKLQYLVFPEGLLYNKKKGAYRTGKVNSLFAEILPLVRVLAENKNGNLKKDCQKSGSVPGTGIEPAHPCERQILSPEMSLFYFNPSDPIFIFLFDCHSLGSEW